MTKRQQPTEQQRLLLHAALLPGAPALAAWCTWRLTADLDQLPPGGFGLLPLLAYNLQQSGISDDLLNKCQGIHRRTWTQNQMRLQTVGALLRPMQDAGLTPLLTGDLPLALLYYPAQGLRAINQLHLWTPATQRAAMQTQLHQAGWRRQQTKQDWLHYLGAGDPNQRWRQPGTDLVLQWRNLPVDGEPSAVALANNHQPLTINGVTVCSMKATELLLWVCVQGVADFWAYGAVQWLVDAMMLLRSPVAAIEWPRLLGLAAQQAVVLRLQTALQGLQAWLDAPIPADVQQTLAALPVQRIEQWEAQLCQRFPGKVGKIITLWGARQREGRRPSSRAGNHDSFE